MDKVKILKLAKWLKLTKEIKTEDTSFEQQMAKEAYSSSATAAASSSLTLTAGSSLLPPPDGRRLQHPAPSP